MVMCPATVCRLQVSLDGFSLAGGVALDFAALADALVRLDMRAGGHFLQVNLHGFVTFYALEGEAAGGFHGIPWTIAGRAVGNARRRGFYRTCRIVTDCCIFATVRSTEWWLSRCR